MLNFLSFLKIPIFQAFSFPFDIIILLWYFSSWFSCKCPFTCLYSFEEFILQSPHFRYFLETHSSHLSPSLFFFFFLLFPLFLSNKYWSGLITSTLTSLPHYISIYWKTPHYQFNKGSLFIHSLMIFSAIGYTVFSVFCSKILFLCPN